MKCGNSGHVVEHNVTKTPVKNAGTHIKRDLYP